MRPLTVNSPGIVTINEFGVVIDGFEFDCGGVARSTLDIQRAALCWAIEQCVKGIMSDDPPQFVNCVAFPEPLIIPRKPT